MKPRKVVLTITLDECDVPVAKLRKASAVELFGCRGLSGTIYELAERPQVAVKGKVRD